MSLPQVEQTLIRMAPKVARWWEGLDIPPAVRRRRAAVARTIADLAGRLSVHHADFVQSARHSRIPEQREHGRG